MRWGGRESSRLWFEITRPARGLQLQGNDAASAARFRLTFGYFSSLVSTAGGRRDTGALPMYHLCTVIISDRPRRLSSAPDIDRFLRIWPPLHPTHAPRLCYDLRYIATYVEGQRAGRYVEREKKVRRGFCLERAKVKKVRRGF